MSNNTAELTKVDRELLMNVVAECGLEVEEQSAYFKCTVPGNNKARIYVAKTSKVTRVDLASFTADADGINVLSEQTIKDLRLGKVKAQIDFTRDVETIVTALRAACETLKVLPVEVPAPKKERTPKTPKAELTPEQIAEKAARRAVIKARAEELRTEEPSSDDVTISDNDVVVTDEALEEVAVG